MPAAADALQPNEVSLRSRHRVCHHSASNHRHRALSGSTPTLLAGRRGEKTGRQKTFRHYHSMTTTLTCWSRRSAGRRFLRSSFGGHSANVGWNTPKLASSKELLFQAVSGFHFPATDISTIERVKGTAAKVKRNQVRDMKPYY